MASLGAHDMRRDLTYILLVMLFSSAVGAATNLAGHRIEWIRRPVSLPVPPVDASRPSATPNGAARNDATAHAPAAGAAAESAQPNGGKPPNGGLPPGFVGADTVLEWLTAGTARFIDAREPAEYAAGHLRGAINLPANAIYANMDKITSLMAPSDRIVVYCGGGGCEASHNVADALRRDFGFTNVLIHEKGWEEIEASGLFTHCIVEGDEP